MQTNEKEKSFSSLILILAEILSLGAILTSLTLSRKYQLKTSLQDLNFQEVVKTKEQFLEQPIWHNSLIGSKTSPSSIKSSFLSEFQR